MNGLDTPSISHILVTIQRDLDHLDRLIYARAIGLMSTERIEQLERELLEEFGKLWRDLESDENRNHVLLAEMESPEFAQQRQRIRDLIESGELVLPGIND
jgi:translation initiation factor 2 alpha subunit (eIF-2alpha)